MIVVGVRHARDHSADDVDGIEFFDRQYDVAAFNARLPRVRVIPIDEFNALEFI